ncbi:MAG: nitroreductase family protein [Proteobacteria bacterium]|nr:nitroreductase family protein [Pseudomonadota bacterium]
MFIDLIRKRRSIRRFQDKPIEPEKMDLLVEAVLRSPSSRSLNPWEFIFVKDKSTLEKLAGSKPHGASFLKHAALGVVVLADPEKCDVWVEDCSIASIFIHLAAQSLDLGSCWIQVRKRMHDSHETSESYIKRLLGIPNPFCVESIVAIGYPDERAEGHPKDALPYDKIFINRYGTLEG